MSANVKLCVVDGRYLLPIDDGAKLVAILAKAELVEWNWTDRCFKRRTLVGGSEEGITLKPLSPADEAKMSMNSEA